MKARRLLVVGVSIAAIALATSCGDSSLTGVPGPSASRRPLFSASDSRADPTGLLACTVLPSASVRQVIGPEGGTIHIGPHTLVISPGALTKTYRIDAEIKPTKTRLVKPPKGRAPKPGFNVVNAVRFEPHLKFRTPVLLMMSYANCDFEDSDSPSTAVVYTNPVLNVIHEIEPSVDDRDAEVVSAWIDHFSNYAIAW